MENSDAMLVACQPRMRSCGSRGWETWHGDWLRYSCVWWEQVLQWRGQSGGSNAATPAIHTLCLIPRTGATGHKGFGAKSEIKRGLIQNFIINTERRAGCGTVRMFLQPYTNTVQCPLWSFSQRTAVPAWMPLCSNNQMDYL